MNNIILIGMPGCGKTSLGKKASEELGLDFLDLDDYVVDRNGMTIEEMFSRSEDFFRDKESSVVREMTGYKNTIISTGGGVIKRKENMDVLKSCGYIVFIHRIPEKIIENVDTETRPLLKDGKERIYNLYRERKDLYVLYADKILYNNDSEEEAVKKLIEIVKEYGVIK